MKLKIDRRTNFGFTLWLETNYSNWAIPCHTRTALVESPATGELLGVSDLFGKPARCRVTIHERKVILHQWTDEPDFRWEGREYTANGR